MRRRQTFIQHWIPGLVLLAFLGSVEMVRGDDARDWQEKVAESIETDSGITGTNAPWESSISLGFQRKSGNTDETTIDVDFRTSKKFERTRFQFEAMESHGETDGETKTDKGSADTHFNYLINQRGFVQASGSAEYDGVADIHYRFIPGIGYGYYFVDNERHILSAVIGPAYVIEKVGNDKKDYAAGRLAAQFRGKLHKETEWWAAGSYIPRLDDLDEYLLDGELGIDAPMGYGVGLRLTIRNEYDSQPAEDKKKNDLTITAGISYKF